MTLSSRERKLESEFQSLLINELEDLFPECIVLKNDSALRQGIPDLVILWQGCWALLEVKAHAKAEQQPNQGWYIELADRLSYGAFIYPENKEAVFDDLQQAFGTRRPARLPFRK